MGLIFYSIMAIILIFGDHYTPKDIFVDGCTIKKDGELSYSEKGCVGDKINGYIIKADYQDNYKLCVFGVDGEKTGFFGCLKETTDEIKERLI